MTIDKRALHPLFGFELHGFDITEDLDATTMAFVGKALSEGGVVLIRNERATESDLVRFASSLGPIHVLQLPKDAVGDQQHTVRLTNLDRDGNIVPITERVQLMSLSNYLWHTDSTFVKPRSSISFLLGVAIPPSGGETQYCDTRVAYEALPEPLRKRIKRLVARHSIVHSRELAGFSGSSAEERARPPISRPLVQVHAPSGRTALCLASHICAIDGLNAAETTELINDLTERATAPDRIYTHHWRAGDVLIWDNRCTMHRARPFDSERYGREMRSVRIVDIADS